MWSNYCKVIAGKYGINVGGVKKLIPNFVLCTSLQEFSVAFIT